MYVKVCARVCTYVKVYACACVCVRVYACVKVCACVSECTHVSECCAHVCLHIEDAAYRRHAPLAGMIESMQVEKTEVLPG